MTPPDTLPADRLQAGRAALAEGNWEEARRYFEAASPDRNSPEALEGLGMACWWLEEYASGIEARECAYRLYRTRGDMVGAARMAVWLCHDYAEYRGETAVANGWLRRAERLLEKLRTRSELRKRASPCSPSRGTHRMERFRCIASRACRPAWD